MELGCGWGNNLRFLKDLNFNYFGIDQSKTATNYCKKYYKNIFCCNFSNVPFDNQFFEIVWILSSFNVYLTLTITEYAQTFDLSPHNVRNKVNSGEFPAEQIGNKWIIQVDAT